ncbi:hypothetical protein F4680DRAFT_425514 [Xylaria scruposa]|nr:hypothetical protein F4680DRAFT_425514 [Xylaria scruposa]
MTTTLFRTLGSSQRAPGSACNPTSKDAQKKRQQLQERRNTYPTQTTTKFTARGRASKLPLPSNSLYSSLRPRRSLPSRLDSYNIAPTDPYYITRLWHDVMASKRGTGRGRKGGSFLPVRSGGDTTADTVPTETALTEPITSVSRASKVGMKDFVVSVLLPHGIVLNESGRTLSFHDHFRFSEKLVPQDHQKRLDYFEEKFPLRIWLKASEEAVQEIQEQYELMDLRRCLEAEFQALALEAIFVRVPWDRRKTRDTSMRPVRILQRIPERPSKGSEPLPSSFLAPPRQDPEGKQYDWDIRPDCAYYLSLEAFDGILRQQVPSTFPTLYRQAFCSYLSIEFKKDNQDIGTAKNQIAVASSISLYNRWCLKRNVLKLSNKHGNWPEKDTDQLRHYCVMLAGSLWSVWCTTPKTYEDWSGCTVSHMSSGDCGDPQSLVLFFTILNDIHFWGLTVHAESCVADVGVIFRGGPNGRITLGPEEVRKLAKSGKGNAVQETGDQSKE